MTAVSVVIPYRSDGDRWRALARGWVTDRLERTFPSWDIVYGASPEGPFNRSAAILDGARRADGEVLVISDADVWTDGLPAAVGAVLRGTHRWAKPHNLIHRLSPASTEQVHHGAEWRGLPLDDTNRQDRRPYKGNETGTLYVIHRTALNDVPPDVRFVGWGQEDQAHAIALNVLVGPAWHGNADLVHLWHPPQERLTRVYGSEAGRDLLRRYQAARRRPDELRALLDESRSVAA